jgi:glycosyltransferase involved in cell wall biosynthesis
MLAEELPLVTFALFAYNQERFIREAVKGALSQTYSPLEIILSDDCSNDETFNIMKEMVAAYSGPHRIILNRNDVNLGIGSHVNKVMNLASGELVIMAAGDDRSLPERAKIITSSWECAGRPSGVGSAVDVIDEEGIVIEFSPDWVISKGLCVNGVNTRELLQMLINGNDPALLGAAAAWSKANWSYFGPLSDNVVHEDSALLVRSCIRGGLSFVNEPLVLYRQHQSNVYARGGREIYSTPARIVEYERQHMRRIDWRIASYYNYIKDVDKAIEECCQNGAELRAFRGLIAERIETDVRRSKWWEKSLIYRLRNFSAMPYKTGISRWATFLNLRHYAVVRWCFERCKNKLLKVTRGSGLKRGGGATRKPH